MSHVAENIAALESKICAVCERSGRRREEVRLVAVAKTFPAGLVDEAIAAGATDIAENRVQEAKDKRADVRHSARWHLIGHLQSNKAKEAARLFDIIETVDSGDLGAKLAREANALGKHLQVLVQVNVGLEQQKSGIEPGDLGELLASVTALPGLELRGLMTIPPLSNDDETTRGYFRRLRDLRAEFQPQYPSLTELSMGMSDDFEIAIEEGSTLIRIGRAIFGRRKG